MLWYERRAQLRHVSVAAAAAGPARAGRAAVVLRAARAAGPPQPRAAKPHALPGYTA